MVLAGAKIPPYLDWPKKAVAAQMAYLVLAATCFAAMACCFCCRMLLALVCFCEACFFSDFGDLSPIVSVFHLTVCLKSWPA